VFKKKNNLFYLDTDSENHLDLQIELSFN